MQLTPLYLNELNNTKSLSSLPSQSAMQPGNNIQDKDSNEWEWAQMTDNNFVNLCVFHVPDKPLNRQVHFVKTKNLNLLFVKIFSGSK